MPLGQPIRGRTRLGLDNPFTRNIDPTLVLDMPFSEGIGTTVRDRSLYGNHGTIDGASWVDGKIGKALSFDGVANNMICLGTENKLNPVEGSIAFWFKSLLGAVPSGQVIMQKAGSTAWNAIYTEGDGRLNYRINKAGVLYSVYAASTLWADGAWHHIVGAYNKTLNGGTQFLYVDSNLIDSAILGIGDLSPNAFGNFRFGYDFPMICDEVRVYNRALSAAEILRLYNEGK